MLWRCWLGDRKGIRPVKNTSGGVLVWLSVWSKVQTCIWPGWCHCHSLSLASVKSRLVLPFWYRLTRVVPDGQRAVKWVCVYKYKYWTELSLTGSVNVPHLHLPTSRTASSRRQLHMWQCLLDWHARPRFTGLPSSVSSAASLSSCFLWKTTTLCWRCFRTTHTAFKFS